MSLRTKVLSGVFWIGSARVLSQITNWAISIVVIRLLTPADYGLLAMATVFLSFVVIFAEAGMGVALIQAKDLNEAMLRSAFGAIIAISVRARRADVSGGPFYRRLLRRGPGDGGRARHRAQYAAVHVLHHPGRPCLPATWTSKGRPWCRWEAACSGGCARWDMALSGYGVWALVAGQLTMHACMAIGLNAISPFLKWPDFSLRGARATLAFGGKVTASRVLWFLSSQADILIGGKMLGKELLGYLLGFDARRVAAGAEDRLPDQ